MLNIVVITATNRATLAAMNTLCTASIVSHWPLIGDKSPLHSLTRS